MEFARTAFGWAKIGAGLGFLCMGFINGNSAFPEADRLNGNSQNSVAETVVDYGQYVWSGNWSTFINPDSPGTSTEANDAIKNAGTSVTSVLIGAGLLINRYRDRK